MNCENLKDSFQIVPSLENENNDNFVDDLIAWTHHLSTLLKCVFVKLSKLLYGHTFFSAFRKTFEPTIFDDFSNKTHFTYLVVI